MSVQQSIKIVKKHICKICEFQYKSRQSLWNHNNKFHKNDNNINQQDTDDKNNNIKKQDTNDNLVCKFCNKTFSFIQSRWRHMKTCKKKENYNLLQKSYEKINELEIKLTDLKKNNNLKSSIANNNCKTINNKDVFDNLLNNHLVDIIMDKNKALGDKDKAYQELQTQNNNINSSSSTQLIQEVKVDDIIEPPSLTVNNIVIISRIEDNYINATQLCKAGDMNFNIWVSLYSTKEIINELAIETEFLISQLIDIKKDNNQEIWIHPDLAIRLAQWISPKFGFQISKWIRTLFSNDTEVNIKMLKEQEKELKLKDKQIQLLKDQYIKKQQRKDYPENNVIYIVTTEDNKKKRIYIVGKAKKLKDRLGPYNKTAEHEVVYYQPCKNGEHLKIIESIVLNKMEPYREKANRDRFVLPINKELSLFTNIIENTIKFFYNKNEEDIEV